VLNEIGGSCDSAIDLDLHLVVIGWSTALGGISPLTIISLGIGLHVHGPIQTHRIDAIVISRDWCLRMEVDPSHSCLRVNDAKERHCPPAGPIFARMVTPLPGGASWTTVLFTI